MRELEGILYRRFNRVGFLGGMWLFSSGLFLTKILPISPVHVAFSVSWVMFITGYVIHREAKLGYFAFSSALISGYFVFQILLTTPAIVLNLLITLLSPVLVYVFFINRFISSRVFVLYFLFYACLFIFDGVWRVTHPAEMDLERLAELGILFQIYKLNSFMYMDSNFVGVQAVSLLSFACWMIISGYRVSLWLLLLMFLAVSLTFSRAAIISALFVLVFTYILSKGIRVYYLYPALLVIAVSACVVLISHFSDDVSFLSKFHIFEVASSYLYQAGYRELIFGVGVGNSKENIGIGAHNIFVTYLIETGVSGFLLFISILVYWLAIFRLSWLVLVFPTLLASMSLGTTAMPYFFTEVALAILIQRGLTAVSGRKLVLMNKGVEHA